MDSKERELNKIEEEKKIDMNNKEPIKMQRREDKMKMKGSKTD